jgi:ubiquinone/menaquinone biosynthesis C-methylase UbiE
VDHYVSTPSAAERRLTQTVASYSKFAERYAAMTRSADVRGNLERFVERLPADNRVVVDACCGTARDVEYFAAHGVSGIAVDLCAPLLARAQTRPGWCIAQADARELPVADGVADGVWCCAGLVHMSHGQTLDALREFARVLSPGGILFASVRGNARAGWERSGGFDRWFERYTEHDVSSLLRHAGFTVESAAGDADGLRRGDITWLAVHARKGAA